MRTLGTFTPRSYGSISEATAKLIDFVGGLVAADENCSRGKSQLQRYSDGNKPDTTIPVHVALELEAIIDEAPVTEHMAAANNMIAIHLPPPNSKRRWLEHVARITKEFSDVIDKASEFLQDDGDIDPNEASKLLKEIDENLTVLADMRYDVDKRRREKTFSAA